MIEINDENLLFILGEIVKNKDFFDRLRKDFDEISVDLVTFKYNPNCSCRSKVVKYFIEKLKENKNLLDFYINKIENIEKKISRKSEVIIGKIFTIPKKSWEEFSKSIKEKYFRSFSIIEKGEELKVYFL